MADGLVITGPTASGKTALSVDVAKRVHGEIISMDSRQIYKGMTVGTAKPTFEERTDVAHHGFDIVKPGERYSAGRFAADARRWIGEIAARGHVPILVGGTGFFLRALTHPLFDEPALDPARKQALKEYFSGWSREELLTWLERLDETSAHRLSKAGGRQRIERALEVALLSGRSLSDWHRDQQPTSGMRFVTVVLKLPRAELYRRINERVDEMLRNGLVDEVRALLAAGYDDMTAGMNATGYREIISWLRGECSEAAAAEAIRAATRQYARRQETWFRHQLPDDAVFMDAMRPKAELAKEIVDRWQRESRS